MTEDCFHTMLDADPSNHGCRLVYADWLEEQGDWRAAGYRWLGEHERHAVQEPPMPNYRLPLSWYFFEDDRRWHPYWEKCRVPRCFIRAVNDACGFHRSSRRAAEDEFCQAYKVVAKIRA